MFNSLKYYMIPWYGLMGVSGAVFLRDTLAVYLKEPTFINHTGYVIISLTLLFSMHAFRSLKNEWKNQAQINFELYKNELLERIKLEKKG